MPTAVVFDRPIKLRALKLTSMYITTKTLLVLEYRRLLTPTRCHEQRKQSYYYLASLDSVLSIGG